MDVLRTRGAAFDRDGDALQVTTHDGDLLSLMRAMYSEFEPGERNGTRTLFIPDGKVMTLADYLEVEPLDRHIARLEGRWLAEIIEGEALHSLLQPIVHVGGDRVFGYECLVRGTHAEQTVMPDVLIDVATRAEMLSPFDHAARRSAVRTLGRYPDIPYAFINVSPRAIYDAETCLQPTVDQLDAIAFPHERVVFEVTESEYADPHVIAQIMRFYREKGFLVALDDLGAGFASLALLEALRPDVIKIDRQFVSGVDADPYRATICAKLLDIAHSAGARTVVEGIETAGELAWAQAHGATYAQGFYFARPSAEPITDFPHLRATPA